MPTKSALFGVAKDFLSKVGKADLSECTSWHEQAVFVVEAATGQETDDDLLFETVMLFRAAKLLSVTSTGFTVVEKAKDGPFRPSSLWSKVGGTAPVSGKCYKKIVFLPRPTVPSAATLPESSCSEEICDTLAMFYQDTTGKDIPEGLCVFESVEPV